VTNSYLPTTPESKSGGQGKNDRSLVSCARTTMSSVLDITSSSLICTFQTRVGPHRTDQADRRHHPNALTVATNIYSLATNSVSAALRPGFRLSPSFVRPCHMRRAICRHSKLQTTCGSFLTRLISRIHESKGYRRSLLSVFEGSSGAHGDVQQRPRWADRATAG
jgi:hypothetical protein